MIVISEKRREYKNQWRRNKTKSENKIGKYRASKSLIGKTFGRLTVVGQSDTKNIQTYWICKCECGVDKIVLRSDLTNGTVKSCGCLKKDVLLKRNTKHVMTGTKEYTAWNNMKARCYNPKDKNYKNYGELGITVCNRWLESFDNFIEDMGICPSKELSIDRIKTAGNYEKNNCRWADIFIQANNKKRNVSITYNGYTMNIAQWARVFSIDPHRFYKERFKGWAKEKIVDFFYNKGQIDYALISNYNKTS